MRDFQIFSDSTCDLPEQLINEQDIKVIPFYVSFEKDIYYKENVCISKEVLYECMEKENGTAMNAKTILEEQYPEAHFRILYNVQATGEQGLLLLD